MKKIIAGFLVLAGCAGSPVQKPVVVEAVPAENPAPVQPATPATLPEPRPAPVAPAVKAPPQNVKTITWLLKKGKLSGPGAWARTPQQISKHQNKKTPGTTAEVCYNYGAFSVVEMRSTDEVGAAEITVRHAPPAGKALCAVDFEGKPHNLNMIEGYFAGVAGGMVLIDGADSSEGQTEFQLFSVETGKELLKTYHHPTETFAIVQKGDAVSVEFFARLKINCDLPKEGQPCWKKTLSENKVSKATAMPDCSKVKDLAMVMTLARANPLKSPRIELVGEGPPAKRRHSMKSLKLILAIILFAASAVLCRQIILNSVANQQNKIDYAEINHIKYGMFSVNAWKKQLAVIIADEITKLNLSTANERQLKKHVEIQLNGLIDNVNKRIKESNKGSFKGWMKQTVINAVVDIEDIKEGIPQYADAIVEQMTKVKTERLLKAALKKRIEQYFDKTFETQDVSQLNRILKNTDTLDIENARIKLDQVIDRDQDKLYRQTWALVALALLLFSISGFSRERVPAPQYFLMLLTLILLLLAGVTTPMIDMEAKISAMNFTLLDHPISFVNQVLYFQTKSIIDVFWIMITHSEVQMQVVGILMVAFSIVFPLLKMISSVGYYYNFRNARDNALVKFFVLKSGKWSMTDVLIVAIFMAYIGFNGIITSQFGNFSAADQEVVILTTNGTSLQPGFYIFLTYTLLALFLSTFLTRKPNG